MAKKRKIILLVIVIAAAAAVFLCIWMLNRPKEAEKTSDSSAYLDPNAENWEMEVPEEMEEEVQAAKEGDQILVPGYSWAEMTSGDKTLSISIGNPEENTCYLQASLIVNVDGTEKTLYESGLLEPGKGVREAELKETLPAGTYEAMIRFQAYTLEDKNELNSVDSAFKLNVAEK